jgi:tripartite-type tricarboxylate transporter receptor subunit TctC
MCMVSALRRLTRPACVAAVLSVIIAEVASVRAAKADATDYPSRAITFVSPWPAGGAADALARVLAPKLQDRLRQNVVVENRPGGGGVLGVASVARAAPDGYTIVMGGSVSLASSSTTYRKPLFDPATAFAPISLVGRVPYILVSNAALPFANVQELIAYARERPGQLSFASGGPGSPHHLYMQVFLGATGLSMTHVPYRGSLAGLTDVAAGHVQLMIADIVAALPLVSSGRVRALGVTSRQRVASAPDIPTIEEGGVPGYEGLGWVMMVAPAHTPPDVVARLHAELNSVVAAPDVHAELTRLGMTPIKSPPPAELERFIRSEIVRWGEVVERAGIARSQ